MIDRRKFSVSALATSGSLALGLPTLSGSAFAQGAYPSKPIRIIFPVASGGGVEALLRLIGNKMTDSLGQPVVVENKPGGNTQLGINFVAKSAPDGYTLAMGFVSNLALAPHTFKTLPYDVSKELAAVALLSTNYLALVTRPDAPFASIAEMSDYAKSSKAGISVGTTSIGGLPHLAFEQLARLSNAPSTVVAYQGNGPLLQDLVGSRLDVAMVDYTAAQQLIDTKRIRLIGITNPQRDPRHPGIPTIAETVKGYQAVGWFGIVAPAATPTAIIEALNKAIVAAVGTAEVQQSMATFGLLPAAGSSRDFAALLKSEDQRYAALVRQIDFKPQ